MPFNGSGSYSPPGASFPAVSGTIIESAKYNNVVNDMATALSTCIAKDGQTTITANLPMATYRHTGVGNAQALTDYASADQIVDNLLTYAGASSGGTDTYAVTLPISPGAYAAGQRYQFIADVDNTGGCAANFNALGAVAIKQLDGSDPLDGMIKANGVVDVIHDGTNLLLLNTFTSMSTFMRTVLDDADAGTARTTLGAVGLTGDETINGIKTFQATSGAVISTFESNQSGGGYVLVRDDLNSTSRGFIGYGSNPFSGGAISDFGLRSQGDLVFASGGNTIVGRFTSAGVFEADEIGIGTSTVPHGSVGYAKLAVDGTDSSADGPHVQFTTTADDYPVMSLFNYTHDNVALLFDAYYDGAWKSSDAGSNAQIYKSSNDLLFRYDSGVSQGAAITWNEALAIDLSNGNVSIGGIDITPQKKVKTADESVTSSTTLQDDDHFQGYNLTAGKWYGIRGVWRISCNGGDGIRLLLSFTNTPNNVGWSAFEWLDSTSGDRKSKLSPDPTTVQTNGGITGASTIQFDGAFQANSTTGGTMKMQWAQFASSATATTLLAGSHLEIYELEG
ncbi:MAG: hypothetical protein GWN00_19775 [Aliifodinibius sp.]|nr:hypothetical protein [Fodinibius sp.]NIY26962.1 hypothetical protein [Fodinibius sp.]